MNQYVKQYQKTHIQTASQEAILIMLHDAAIQFMNKAKLAIEQKNIQEAHNNLIRTQDIFNEFLNTLNPEPNPDLAKHLTILYRYLISQLVQANIKQITEPIDIVLGYTKDLKQTWEQAIFKMKAQEAGSAPSVGGYQTSQPNMPTESANYDA